MPPGRKERGRHSLSFLNRSDHFSHSLLWGPGLVRFLLLSTQFSVFVRDHLRRKDRYKFFFGGAAVKGRFPFSIEVGKGVIDLFWIRPYWPSGGISFIADEKKSLWAELQKEVQAQEILSTGIGQASCLFILFYPVVRRDVKSTKYMCVHSVPGTFLLAEYGCWSSLECGASAW